MKPRKKWNTMNAPSHRMPRSVVNAVGVMTSFAVAGLALRSACAAPLVVTAAGSTQLGSTTADQDAVPFTVTGLSGVVRTPEGVFVAVMDNSNKVVRFSLGVNPVDGSVSSGALLPGISLAQQRDFEGIALIPPSGTGFGTGDILLSDEGVAGSVLPMVTRWNLTTGSLLGPLETPPVFAAIRANFGFESLTSGTGRTGLPEVWTANEEALTTDGPGSSATDATMVRLLRYVNGVPSQQFVYVCDPWHGGAITGGARSGLSDLCMLPDGRLLALERSFALSGSGFFRTRIYEVNTAAATDVSAFASLSAGGFTPAAKTLLYSGFLQNVEGLCVGPALAAAGTFSLIGITDDADPISTNTVNAWRVSGVGPASCLADLNADGLRNTPDLTAFLGAFGRTGAPGFIAADLNGDGVVNTADLVTFLGRFGVACQ
jgi:hypothetical protein